MGNTIKTYTLCNRCHGTGVYTMEDPDLENPEIEGYTEDPCKNCGGSGYFESGKIKNNLFVDMDDKINDIKNKVDDIMEKLNE